MEEHRELGGRFKINNKTYAIYGGLNTIGRNREAVVNIKSLGISQHHALFILIDDDLHFVSDLKSSNGTYLDGKKLVPLQLYRLQNGARLKFADIEGIYSQKSHISDGVGNCVQDNNKKTIDPQEAQTQKIPKVHSIAVISSKKCTSEDAKFASPTNSECTQNSTQSFYGIDTQIMDDTITNQSNKTQIFPFKCPNYIPTQELVKVASALETSLEKLHEQPTQLILESENVHEMQTQLFERCEVQDIKKINLGESETLNLPSDQFDSHMSDVPDLVEKSVCDIDSSVIDPHEAETQKLPLFDSSSKVSDTHEDDKQVLVDESEDNTLHEMETQRLQDNVTNTSERIPNATEGPVEHQEGDPFVRSSNDSTSQNSSHNEINRNGLDRSSDNSDIIRSISEMKKSSGSLDTTTQDSDIVNPIGKVRRILTESQSSITETSQNSDIVFPVGKPRRILDETQNSVNESMNDSDSDIVRPVKKSMNAFDLFQESLLNNDDLGEETDNENSNDLPRLTRKTTKIEQEDTEDSNDTDRDIKKPKQKTLNVFGRVSVGEETSDEDTNDSLEFMKKIKVAEQHYLELEDGLEPSTTVQNISAKGAGKYGENMQDITEVKSDDMELTRLGADNERREESICGSRVQKIKNCASSKSPENENIPKENTPDSETDTEKNRDMNNSNSSSRMTLDKKKRTNPRRKVENLQSESESDTEVKSKERVKTVITNSETDNLYKVESDEGALLIDSGSETETEEDKENRCLPNNSIASTILGDSILEEGREIDETKIEAFNNTYEDNITKKNKQLMSGLNYSLNDSDIIPATQEPVEKIAKSISQSSKFENSEDSFRLGLTQLMDDEVGGISSLPEKCVSQKAVEKGEKLNSEEQNDDSTNGNSASSNEAKKFVFKKKKSENTNPVDITLDYPDDEMYEAQTQVIKEVTADKSEDDKIFLQPTQTVPSRKRTSKEKPIIEEDIYMLSTQKFDGSPSKITHEDIYLQSTQKLTEECIDPGEGTSKMGFANEDIYQQATQKLQTPKETSNVEVKENIEEDIDDMFASQMSPKTTPKKILESELEYMFASQKPAGDTLDKIQDIVCSKSVVDTKLPEGDSDLEAILSTQRFSDSPKTSKRNVRLEQQEMVLGRSIETQLEVLFASQTANLPPDKFERPANPLVNVFQEDSEQTKEMTSKENTDKTVLSDDSSFDRGEVSECNSTVSRNSHVGLEQSFALLEAKSTKIRRSARATNCKEVTVSCPKSRRSMTIAPTEKVAKVPEDTESISAKGVIPRSMSKRQWSISSETSNSDVKERKSGRIMASKRRISDSDDESRSSIASSSSRSTRATKQLTLIEEDDFEDVEKLPKITSKKRLQENKNDSNEIEDERKGTKVLETQPKSRGRPRNESKDKLGKSVKAQEETEVKSGKGINSRATRKRRPSTSSETSNSDLKERKSGHLTRRKNSESLNISDDESSSNVPSSSRTSKQMALIQEAEDDDFEDILPKITSKKRLQENKSNNETPDVQEKTSDCLGNDSVRGKGKKAVIDTPKGKSRRTNQTSEIKDGKTNSTTETNDSDDTEIMKKPRGRSSKIEDKTKSASRSSSNSSVNENKASSSLFNNNSSEIMKKPRGRTAKIEEKTKSASRSSSSSSSSVNENHSGSSSHAVKRTTTIEVTTPSKSRRLTVPSTPSAGRKLMEDQDTPNRNKRKLKPKVVFTMMDNPQLESVIRQLGGSVVDSVDISTVLITHSVKRSMKLLSAVGLGKPICSSKWVEDSKKQHEFLDPWDYVLVDKEAEKKWNFSLRTSLERSSREKLFEGYTFQLLVTIAVDVLKGAIESCGGKVVARSPKETDNFVVVASPDSPAKYKKLIKLQPNLIIVEPEAIFDGVLRQEIRFERHLLK